MSEKRAREEPAVGAPVAAGPVYNSNTINFYFAPVTKQEVQDAAAQTEPPKKKQKAEPLVWKH